MDITTRRGKIMAAGHAAAIASLTKPMAAIAEPQHESELQRRLSLWAESVRAYTFYPLPVGDAGWVALHHAAQALHSEAMAVPATSAEDMAIKAYLAIHYAMGGKQGNAFGIEYDAGVMTYDAPAERVVTDALRLSPLLRSIVDRGNG